MADFEGLIRQALARQDDTDPAVREKVYQSSRKALARMIASAGVQPPEVINRQRMALENSIRRIEESYRSAQATAGQRPASPPFGQPRREVPSPATGHAPEPGIFRQPSRLHRFPPAAARREAIVEGEPEIGEPTVDQSAGMGPEFGYGSPDIEGVEHEGAYPGYEGGGEEEDGGRAGFRRRIIALAVFVVILVLVAGLLYAIFTTLIGSGAPPDRADDAATSEPAGDAANANSVLVTILSPEDTTALDTAGRGRAEIVNQSNLEMIRLTSLRSGGALDKPAEPMLIEIQDGALRQIAGKTVTVEIQAKSGMSGPATFTVGCEIGGEDLCARKRFRVGIQPEPIVFTIDVKADLADAGQANLMINTDISSTASLSGEGEPVDIVYVKFRIPK